MIAYSSQPPLISDFIALRAHVGWGQTEINLATKAVAASLHFVCARCDNKVIGFGRIIGDGALNYYIQDLIVHADYQGQGIGREMMGQMMAWLKTHAKGATVGLMSVAGKEGFYETFGFRARPVGALGCGMTVDIV